MRTTQKKKLRRSDLPVATGGLTDRRRKREFRALMRTSDAAYVTRRFKEKKGPMKRRFPTPYRASRLERAGRFIHWRSTNV
ncbi:MAG: hypothetical protein RLZZ403_469 [Pseudomonadota bacterium]